MASKTKQTHEETEPAAAEPQEHDVQTEEVTGEDKTVDNGMGGVPKVVAKIESNKAPGKNPWPWIFLAVVAMLCVTYLLVSVLTASNTSANVSQENIPSSNTTLQLNSQLSRAETAEEQKRILLQTDMMRLKSKIDLGLKLLDEAHTLKKEWDQETTALLTNEQGRRIANDEQSTIAFLSLTEKEPVVSDEMLDLHRAQFTALRRPIDDASQHNAVTPLVDDIKERVGLMWDGIRGSTETLSEDLATIRNLGSGNTVGATTLEEAIKTVRARYAKERAEKIAAAEEAERLAGDVKIAAERAQLLRSRKQLEAQNIADKRSAQEEAALEQRNIAEAKHPATQLALASFITPGHWVPGNNQRSLDKKPMSWAYIKGNALSEDKQGIYMLGYLACYNQQDRPRKAWIQPRNWNTNFVQVIDEDTTREAIEEMRRVQKLLKRLGPTLVGLGMLEP